MALISEKGLVKFRLRPKDFISERRSKGPVSEESSNHDDPSEENGEHRNDEPRPPTILEKSLVKLHLRPKEPVSEGRSGELVPEESSRVGGASEENVEQHSEDRRPPTAFEKGLIKLRLRPKERVSEGHSEDLVSEELDSEELDLKERSKNGGVSEEHGKQRSEETRPPTLLGKSLVKLHLRPKEGVSDGCSKELVSEESFKGPGDSEGNGDLHSEEPHPPTMLEKGLVKLHLRPKERTFGRSRETVTEEGSKEVGASEGNDEQCIEPRPPKVHILHETGPTVVFYGLLDRDRAVILPVNLRFTVLEAESSIEYYDLILLRKLTPNIPVNSECPQCKVVTSIPYRQRIDANGIRFEKGEHTLNVAWTVPGDLTPSSHTCFGSITYDFRALVNTTRDGNIYSAWQPLLVKRYIRPHPRKSFHRVFPTPRSEVVTVTTVPQTIHPTGEFPVHLRLTNLKTPERDVSGKLCHWRWFLHKVSWSILEQTTWASAGCFNHTPETNLFRRVDPLVEDEAFEMRSTYENNHKIGSGVFHEGWTTNFAYPGYGKIDFDFTVSINLGCAPVSSFRTWNEEYSVKHFLLIEMLLEDDMTGDLIGPVIPAQRLRVLSQLNIEEDSAKSVNWDEADPDIADDNGDGDSDEQSAAVPSVNSSIGTDIDQDGKEEREKKAEEIKGGDSWFVPGQPDKRGRPTYEFVGRGSRNQSLVGRQQVPQLELEEGAGGDVDEEGFRPIIPDL